MRRLTLWAFLVGVAALANAGCQSADTPSYPNDPLFVSKKPIEVKPDTDATHLVQNVVPTAVRGARP
jgi:hypothetical protein